MFDAGEGLAEVHLLVEGIVNHGEGEFLPVVWDAQARVAEHGDAGLLQRALGWRGL